MLVVEKNALSEEIESYVKKYGKDRSSLLPVLHAVQRKHSYVSDFAQQEIARLLDIHPVEVFSVISFYSFLHSKPTGRNIVRLCRTISCDMANKSCVGMCDQGPAMIVNDRVYTKLDPEKAVNILNEIK